MRARIVIHPEGAKLAVGDHLLDLRPGASFELELTGEQVASAIALDDRQKAAFELAAALFDGGGRRPGRPPKAVKPATSTKIDSSAARAPGRSPWSGQPSSARRYGHLTSEEIKMLGASRMAGSELKQLLALLRAAGEQGHWDAIRKRFEPGLVHAKDDEDRTRKVRDLVQTLQAKVEPGGASDWHRG